MRKRYYIRSLIFIFVLFVFMGAKVWAQDNSLIEERKVEVLEPHINIEDDSKVETNNEYLEIDEIKPNLDEFNASVTDGQYTYEIKPILLNFNEYIYVKTNNPNPDSFRFIDKTTVYEQGGGFEALYEHARKIFIDVKYENTSNFRVKGGYIFSAGYGSLPDGGELVLQKKNGTIWQDTTTKITLGVLYDTTDYLIKYHTSTSKTLFENLSSIQTFLDQHAVYPARIIDATRPTRQYQFLASSPYPELSLNDHLENVYHKYEDGSLMYSSYPFVLDSSGFPSIMYEATLKLNPLAEIEWSNYHYLIEVTLNGESKYYGGAGKGDRNPISTKYFTKIYTFDMLAGDYTLNTSLKSQYDRLMQLKVKADGDAQILIDSLRGSTFNSKIGPGTWIRVAIEGRSTSTFAYVAKGPAEDTHWIASDAWVDGRYVNNHEVVEYGKVFSNFPQADIIVRNMSYKDKYGNAHKNDVIFEYDETSKTWRAPYYYSNAFSYNTNEALPEEFILTRSEVDAMRVDRNTNSLVKNGLIYDGSEVPGTPFYSYYVTSNNVNIRDKAIDGKIIGVKQKGEIVSGQIEGNYLRFKENNQDKYIHKSLISLTFIDRPTLNVYVSGYSANVRSAEFNGYILGTKARGELLKAKAQGYYYVFTENGRDSFIHRSLVTTTPVKGNFYIKQNGVNVREVSTNTVKKVFNKGIYVNGYQKDGWVYFTLNKINYKVSASFTIVQNPKKAYITTSNVNIRDQFGNVKRQSVRWENINCVLIGDQYRFMDNGYIRFIHKSFVRLY